MDNYNWGLFGYIPKKHRNWFLKMSGTKYTRDGWVVTSTRIEEGDKKILLASKFQKNYIEAKRIILQNMQGVGKYQFKNEYVFDLLRYGETEVEYEYRGEKYKKLIKINKD